MCALHREGKFVLPEQWIDLIQAIIEILVNERDRDRGVIDTLWLPAGQRIGVLQDLAYWMTTENVPTLKRDRVLERVKYKLEGARLAAAREGHSGSADEVLDYLITRSGLIHAAGDDLGFTSEILRGYLAACEAVSGGNIGSLIREAHMAERQHLMVMVAGRSRLAVAEELLTGLLEKAEQDAAARTRLHLLIRACLHTAPAVGQELRERIEACCGPKTPRTAVEAETLAAAGPLVVDMLASHPLDDVESVVASIHAAAHVGSEDVLPFLARLARDGRPAVTEALRAAAAAFDTAEYERLVPVDLASEADPQAASTLVSGGGGTHG
jgi:hypothetical protein